MVHTSIICARSPFFKAACERWSKGAKPLDLLEDDAKTFDAYLQYVYADKAQEEQDSLDLGLQTRVCILADKLGDLRSANKAIDDIVRLSDEWAMAPDYTIASHAWTSTPENSPLRRLLVDYWVHEMSHVAFDDKADLIPHGMLVAVAKEFRRLKAKEWKAPHTTLWRTCSRNTRVVRRSAGTISMMRLQIIVSSWQDT